MRHGSETVGAGKAGFNFPQKTFFNFHHGRALGADQMMVVGIPAFTDKFKPRRAIAKINPFHHLHFFQQVHRAINRRQIALTLGNGGENFLAGQRAGLRAQNFQNDLARTSHFARMPAQSGR